MMALCCIETQVGMDTNPPSHISTQQGSVVVGTGKESPGSGSSSDMHELHLPSKNTYLAHRHMPQLLLFMHTIKPVLHCHTSHCCPTPFAIVLSLPTHS